MNRLPGAIGRHLAAIRAMILFTVILGIAYPLLVTGIAQLGFKNTADGSLLTNSRGQVVGSKLLCQSFTAKDGTPLPQYFQSRPSDAVNSANAAAANDPKNVDGAYYACDPTQSGASNLGPNSAALAANIKNYQAVMAKFDSVGDYVVTAAQVAPDAVTASASGLDPDISVLNADQQAHRIATTRDLPLGTVQGLIAKYTDGRDLGFLGEPGVNVLELNLALDELQGKA
ncbi:MAG TPA: K(+)-transporting ATPase subunit C [Actinocrinis sp.]|nr:K(+)-transporting ATPase subunit C [Actinocrinis sp.]